MVVTLVMIVSGLIDFSIFIVWMGLRNSGRELLMLLIRIVMMVVFERGTVFRSVVIIVSL